MKLLQSTVFILFIMVMCVSAVSAQEKKSGKSKKSDRPADIGIVEYDEFKNSSFDLYEKSVKYKEIYEAGKLSDGNIRDISSAKKDLVALGVQSASMVKNAKELSVDQSVRAVRITNKSIKAINKAKKNINYVLDGMRGKE
ncbi:MAG: hypothetical protein C0594_04095 [Marinilabiliales bacterium]|nr:MAG: hypothetical protein C0594_04095 [Marinilabiliales bacterium]